MSNTERSTQKKAGEELPGGPIRPDPETKRQTLEEAKAEATDMMEKRGITVTDELMESALAHFNKNYPERGGLPSSSGILTAVYELRKGNDNQEKKVVESTEPTKRLTAEEVDDRDGTGLLPSTQKWSTGSNF